MDAADEDREREEKEEKGVPADADGGRGGDDADADADAADAAGGQPAAAAEAAMDEDDGDGDGKGAGGANADAADDDDDVDVDELFGEDSDEDEDAEEQRRDAERVRQMNKKRPRQADPEEEEDDDDDADDDADDDDDDDDVFASSSSSRRGKAKKGKAEAKGRKKPRRRIDVSNFFLEEAEQGEDEEAEEEERLAEEEVLEEDHQAAVDAVERRHRAARERLSMSAEELAEEYERRHREQARRQKMQGQMYGGAEGGVRIGSSAVMQQSLLPSINDPGIWKVKCAPGKELALVRSLLLKVFDSRARGQPMHIKTAFCNATKGYIYVEALAEPYAREAITGLRGLYQFSFSRIPVQEMTTLLAVTVTKKPMKKGQWVRLKRGPLKGDLARVVDILDGGAKAIVQAIPRPDFSKTTEKVSSGSKAKPSQRMFDVEEARTLGLEVVRRPMPGDRHGRAYDFFNGDFYRDGYLFKEVTVATYIDAENVKPRLDELRLFQAQANKVRRDDDDPYDDDHGAEADAVAESQGLLKDIAAQLKDLGDEESKSSTTPYVAGDVVRVAAGELKNLVGRVVSVDEVTRTVSLQAIKSKEVNQEFDVVTEVEVHLLVKHILPGAHVKVLSGQHAGLTGRVVSVNDFDGDNIAAVLTDGMNTEIQCNVRDLQNSSEVATGHGDLDGYELYDLVALNENEYGVVVLVGPERLRVVNHLDLAKEVRPQELQGKKNHQSSRASAFDSQQTSIYPGDSVKIVSGVHAGKSGAIKHIMKGNLWLHSNTYLKHAGVIAVRARFCVVHGKRAGMLPGAGATSFASSASTAAASVGSKVASVTGPNYKAARDSHVGKTVRITKGQYKGELAQVVDATGTHFSVELLSKMRKVMVEKEKTVLVGDKGGSLDPEKRAQRHPGGMDPRMGPFGIPATPFLTAETPHGIGGETPRMLGNETPMLGGETPGSRTPGYADGGDSWNITESDVLPAATSSSSSAAAASSGVTPFGYSSAQTFNSNSVNSTPTGSHMAWEENYVVVFKKGALTGKFGVVRRRPTADGFVRVSLYDPSSQSLDRDERDVPHGDLALAEPGKKCRIKVVTGSKAGVTGVVKTISGRDVILEQSASAGKMMEMFKLASVVWVY